MLIGVAGHVDHGKTALVHALTGTDADRLPEERRRGMTIDLGFAYAPAADGRILGLVDLPGHERFLHNFMAGALALDNVLLVVAADEGPKPQTREHLAILDRIGVRHLIVAVSKSDRADAGRLAATEAAVRDMLAPTLFADAEIVVTSARTGAGVEALRARLEAAPARPHTPGEGFRMPIDRAFQLTGAGLVVTGAVAAGEAAVGDHLVLSPAGAPARLRSLHAQNREQTRAKAGERCGFALATGERAAARRGAWLLEPRLHAPTEMLLALVRDLPGAALRHGRDARLHLAADALDARVILLGEPSPEAAYPVLLALRRPVAALAGDRLALRDPAAHATLAAGRVLDPFPSDRRRLRKVATAVQIALGAEDPAEALAARLAVDGAVDLARFALARNMPVEAVRTLSGGETFGAVLIAPARADELRKGALDLLAAAHRRHPDRMGLDAQDMAKALAGPDDPAIAAAVLADLVGRGVLRRLGGLLQLPDHQPRLSAEDEALWARLQPLLAVTPERPPTVAELSAMLEIDWRALRQALGRLAHFGRVVQATVNRAFLPEALTSLEQRLEALAVERPGGLFTVADFNAAAGVGRNLSVELLEYFDRRGITQRLGDQRRLARPDGGNGG